MGALFDAGVEVLVAGCHPRAGERVCELGEEPVRSRDRRRGPRGLSGGAAELPGLDPLFIANEGKMVAVVAGSDADQALRSGAFILWGGTPPGGASH